MTRITWYKGLWRFWLVTTVLWIVGTAVFLRFDLSAYWLWKYGPGPLDTTQLEINLHQIEGKEIDLGVDQGQSLSAEIDNVLHKTPYPKKIAKWEKFESEKSNIQIRISKRRIRSMMWGQIKYFCFVAFGLPLGLLLIGVAIVWIIQGFI